MNNYMGSDGSFDAEGKTCTCSHDEIFPFENYVAYCSPSEKIVIDPVPEFPVTWAIPDGC